jgi:hypothetical protein
VPRGTVSRLDPATLALEKRLQVPQPGDVVVGDGRVWVANVLTAPSRGSTARAGGGHSRRRQFSVFALARPGPGGARTDDRLARGSARHIDQEAADRGRAVEVPGRHRWTAAGRRHLGDHRRRPGPPNFEQRPRRSPTSPMASRSPRADWVGQRPTGIAIGFGRVWWPAPIRARSPRSTRGAEPSLPRAFGGPVTSGVRRTPGSPGIGNDRSATCHPKGPGRHWLDRFT